MDDNQYKEEENGSVGELSTVCSQFVLKCFFWPLTEKEDLSVYVDDIKLASKTENIEPTKFP